MYALTSQALYTFPSNLLEFAVSAVDTPEVFLQ